MKLTFMSAKGGSAAGGKKIIILILCLSLSLLITGCVKNLVTFSTCKNIDRGEQYLNDESLKKCETISDKYKHDSCYLDLSIKFKSLAICDKYYAWGKDACYYNIALATANPCICDQIKNVGNSLYQNNCYLNVAIKNKDVSLCEKITDKQCTISYRGSFGDISIDTVNCKDQCFKEINNLK